MIAMLFSLIVQLVIAVASLAIRCALLVGTILGRLLTLLVRAAWRAWRAGRSGRSVPSTTNICEPPAIEQRSSPPAFAPRPLRPGPRARR